MASAREQLAELRSAAADAEDRVTQVKRERQTAARKVKGIETRIAEYAEGVEAGRIEPEPERELSLHDALASAKLEADSPRWVGRERGATETAHRATRAVSEFASAHRAELVEELIGEALPIADARLDAYRAWRDAEAEVDRIVREWYSLSDLLPSLGVPSDNPTKPAQLGLNGAPPPADDDPRWIPVPAELIEAD